MDFLIKLPWQHKMSRHKFQLKNLPISLLKSLFKSLCTFVLKMSNDNFSSGVVILPLNKSACLFNLYFFSRLIKCKTQY